MVVALEHRGDDLLVAAEHAAEGEHEKCETQDSRRSAATERTMAASDSGMWQFLAGASVDADRPAIRRTTESDRTARYR